MGLDIDDLRLTDEERDAEEWRANRLGVPWESEFLLGAQLAKALWGIYDWLEIWPKSALGEALEQANIERPTRTA